MIMYLDFQYQLTSTYFFPYSKNHINYKTIKHLYNMQIMYNTPHTYNIISQQKQPQIQHTN